MRYLIEEHYKKSLSQDVKRMKAYTANNEQDAEDIVQEAYVRALQYGKAFDPINGEIGAWLHKIMINCFRDWRADNYHHSDAIEFDEELYEQDVTTLDNIDSLVYIKENIEKMPEGEEKEVLFLYFSIGLTLRGVSHISGVTYKRVWNILHRFKNKIRE